VALGLGVACFGPLQGKQFNMSIIGRKSKIVPSGKSPTSHGPTVGVMQPSVIELDGADPSSSSQSKRRRGRTNSKVDAKREASSQVVIDIIKTFFL
jgi:hypothetical protein